MRDELVWVVMGMGVLVGVALMIGTLWGVSRDWKATVRDIKEDHIRTREEAIREEQIRRKRVRNYYKALLRDFRRNIKLERAIREIREIGEKLIRELQNQGESKEEALEN